MSAKGRFFKSEINAEGHIPSFLSASVPNLYGTSVSKIQLDGPNHVADAFTYRKFLVHLHFAQRSMFASVKSSEAKTPEDAWKIAARRAMGAYKQYSPLGNLMSAEVYEDTPEQRDKLRIGPKENEEPLWRQAAA